jgi:hypothetical protein
MPLITIYDSSENERYISDPYKLQKRLRHEVIHRELEKMEPLLNFQVPAEGLNLVIY